MIDKPTSSGRRRVDTPDFVLQAARSLLGWSLRNHKTTYSQTVGVEVELQLQSNGGRTIPRSAFRSTLQWDINDFRCVIYRNEATIWLKLRQHFEPPSIEESSNQ